MALARKRDESLNHFVDFFNYAVSRRKIVDCNVFPNLFNVSVGFGVKDKTRHERLERRSLLLRRRRAKACSPSIGCTRPLLTSSYRPSSTLRVSTTSARYP